MHISRSYIRHLISEDVIYKIIIVFLMYNVFLMICFFLHTNKQNGSIILNFFKLSLLRHLEGLRELGHVTQEPLIGGPIRSLGLIGVICV